MTSPAWTQPPLNLPSTRTILLRAKALIDSIDPTVLRAVATIVLAAYTEETPKPRRRAKAKKKAKKRLARRKAPAK